MLLSAMSLRSGSEVRLSGSPSLRFNNASLSTVGLCAYSERERVRVDNPLEGGESRSLSIPGARFISQARWVTVDGGEFLGVASSAGLHLLDRAGDKLLATFPNDDIPKNPDCEQALCGDYVTSVEGVAGTQLLCVGSAQGMLVLMHYDAKRKRLTLEGSARAHRRSVSTLGSSVSHMVSGDENGHVAVWFAGGLEQVCTFPSMGCPCCSVVVRADRVVAAFVSGVVRVYDIARARVQIEIDAHCRALNAIALHPQYDVFASAGEDGFINVWQLPDKRILEVRLVASLRVPDAQFCGVAFLLDGSNRLAALAYDCPKLYVWSN
jgi:WD40 repeat protein